MSLYMQLDEFIYFRYFYTFGSITLAGAIFQWPIGSISDNFERRKIIIVRSWIVSIFAIYHCSLASLKIFYF